MQPASPPSFNNKPTNAIDQLLAMPNLRPPGVVRASSVGPSLTQMPPMIRSTSASRLAAAGAGAGAVAAVPTAAPSGTLYANPSEWRSFVAIEERTDVRVKLTDAYRKVCPTYQELLDMVMAIDEELIFAAAPTRLDYFKTAIDWENRLLIKRKQLAGQVAVSGLLSAHGATSATAATLLSVGAAGTGAAAAALAGAKRKLNGQPATPTITVINPDAAHDALAAAAAASQAAAASASLAPAAAAAAASSSSSSSAAAVSNTAPSPVATTPGGHPLTKKLRVATD